MSNNVGSKAKQAAKKVDEAWERSEKFFTGLETLTKGLDLSPVVSQVGGAVGVLRGLGFAASAATFGVGALIGVITSIVQYLLKKREEAAQAVQDKFTQAKSDGKKASEQLQRDHESGALRSDKAVALKDEVSKRNAEIAELEERVKKAPFEADVRAAQKVPSYYGMSGVGYPYRLPNAPGDTKENLQRQLAEKVAARDATLAEAAKYTGLRADTSLTIDDAAAKSRAAIAQKGFDQEHQNLEAALAKNLISRRTYLREVDALIDKETESHLDAVDIRATQLAEDLQRQKDAGMDRDTIAKTESDLWVARSEHEQIVLDGDNAKEAERRKLEQANLFKPTPVNVDELARIGLFRGGGGQAEVGAQQLEELKRIVEGLRRVDVSVRNA